MESGVLPTVVKQGWLEKKGEYITYWRKRYFALYSDGSFNGYKEEPTQEMIQRSTQNSRYKYENTFTVKNSVVIRHDDREKGDVYFKVRCRQRDVNKDGFVERSFRALSTDERDSWADMIEGVFTELNGERTDEMDTDIPDDPFDLISPPESVRKYTSKDFIYIKMIGRGTFGNVLLVYRKDDPNQTRMAMKQISKEHIREKEETEHTKSELQVLKQCNHPFLIKLHHAFNCRDSLYLVMEFALGGEIYTHLSRCNQFPISRCRFYGAEIVSAFAYLHSMTNPIIYRDLKLENLLLGSDGHIKITDFGLCKILNHEQPSTTTFCGTPEYLAPEILEDNQYGLPVDWWSLGVVLHEMIVGRLPFHSWRNHEDLYEAIIHDPLPELPPRVPNEASQLLHGLLKKRPDERLGGRADAQEIMDHIFFQSIDFAALERKEIRPEYVPVLRNQDDVSHFPSEFTQQPIPNISEPYSVTSHDFDNEFRSFEYNNEHNRSLQDQVMA